MGKKVNHQLLENLVLVKPEAAETKTESGLYIPDAAKEKPLFGTAISVGPKCEAVEPGDKVLYGKFAGTDITYEGQDCKFMRETDLFSITESFETWK